jgi:hypothetical protein
MARPDARVSTAILSPRADRIGADSNGRPSSAARSTTRHAGGDAPDWSTSPIEKDGPAVRTINRPLVAENASTEGPWKGISVPAGDPIDSAPPVSTTRPSRSLGWTSALPSGEGSVVAIAILAAPGDADLNPDGSWLPQAAAATMQVSMRIGPSGPTADRPGRSDDSLGERRLIRRCHHR